MREQSFRMIAAPILVSAIISGTWTDLAFLAGHGRLTSLPVVATLILCFCVLFYASVLTASTICAGFADMDELRASIARCSLASVVLLIFLPEYLARLQPPILRSGLLLGLAASLWIALLTACLLTKRGVSWRPVHIHVAAAFVLAALFTLVTSLAIREYLVFGYVGQDLAYFAQIMHTTLHGHLFWGNMLQDVLYTRPVTTDFAGHNSPFMFVLLPFYAVFPSPITLLVLRNIVIILCAVPTYLIARRHVSPATAWLWAAALLATPAIIAQCTFDFYPLTFVALPLLYTVYFYFERRYAPFCVALLITLSVREDLAFFAVGLGILALFRRRTARWYLTPLTTGIAWGLLSFLFVLPHALHGASFVTDACFNHLGSSRPEMVSNIVHHPGRTLLLHGNVVYLKTLLTPTALVLYAGSPVSFMALPFIGINLLAGGGACITTVIQAQYSVIPALLLFLGALLTGTNPTRRRVLRTIAHLGLPVSAAAPMLLLTLGGASLVFVTGLPQFEQLRENTWNPEARRVLALIPEGASVAAPRYMLPHLANRDCLFQTHRLMQYHTPNYEYLILDTSWNHINAAEQYQGPYEHLLESAPSDPRFKVIYSSAQYEVLHDSSARSRGCEPASSLNPQPTPRP